MTKLRLYILALGLIFSSSLLGSAQSVPSKSIETDTLITVREDELLAILDSLASERIVQDKHNMDLLRYQLLLNLFAQSGQTQQAVVAQSSKVQSESRTNKDPSNVAYEARLNRLERLVQSSLQRYDVAPSTMALVPLQEAKKREQTDTVTLKPNSAEVSEIAQSLVGTAASITTPDTAAVASTIQPIHSVDTIYIEKSQEEVQLGTIYSGSVYFPLGSASLSTYAKATIQEAIATLKQYPNSRLVLRAYASPEGARSKNERLAKQRYTSVLSALMQSGIHASRLNVAPELSIDNSMHLASLARRVDIIIAEY